MPRKGGNAAWKPAPNEARHHIGKGRNLGSNHAPPHSSLHQSHLLLASKHFASIVLCLQTHCRLACSMKGDSHSNQTGAHIPCPMGKGGRPRRKQPRRDFRAAHTAVCLVPQGGQHRPDGARGWAATSTGQHSSSESGTKREGNVCWRRGSKGGI